MWFEACVLSCLTMIFYVLYSGVCYTFIFVSSFHLPHTPSSLRPHAVFVSPKRGRHAIIAPAPRSAARIVVAFEP